jgi:hypothetical protein
LCRRLTFVFHHDPLAKRSQSLSPTMRAHRGAATGGNGVEVIGSSDHLGAGNPEMAAQTRQISARTSERTKYRGIVTPP